jgi:ribonuclease D
VAVKAGGCLIVILIFLLIPLALLRLQIADQQIKRKITIMSKKGKRPASFSHTPSQRALGTGGPAAHTSGVIDTNDKLANFLPALRAAKWVAVDTEADSLHAYPEKVCLIQISIAEADRLVDPLANLDLNHLLDALKGHDLLMHGADYDLRLLWKHHRFTPRSVFDTMLAARLLGQRQFSLNALVAHYLGLTLDKGMQKADWARRPLTERMETYARNDTRHLKPLADKLKLELQQKGRLAWHEESCAWQVTDCARDIEPDAHTVWRTKGSHLLSRPALAVLRELWQWREQEALGGNRPPFFVLAHETLTQIAIAATDSRQIEPLLPRRFSDRRRESLRKAIARGLALPATHHPEILRFTSRRLTETERRRLAELERHRDAHATRLDLDPSLIAPRATLLDLARHGDKHMPELMRWQRELLQA